MCKTAAKIKMIITSMQLEPFKVIIISLYDISWYIISLIIIIVQTQYMGLLSLQNCLCWARPLLTEINKNILSQEALKPDEMPVDWRRAFINSEFLSQKSFSSFIASEYQMLPYKIADIKYNL